MHFFIFGILLILVYGFLQVLITNRFGLIILGDADPLSVMVNFLGAVFSFFSGILLWLFISIVVSVFYEVVFMIDVQKLTIYALAACGFIILLFSFLPTFHFLDIIEKEVQNGLLSIFDIKGSENYLRMQFVQSIFIIIYYLYIWGSVSIIYREGWQTSVKFLVVILTIIGVQYGVLPKLQ